MKKGLFLLAAATLLPLSSEAADNDAAPDSLSGMVGIGMMVIDSGNNLNPDGSKKRLDDLDSGADRETTYLPMILPKATWDVGEPEGAKLYFTTDPPIDEVGGFAFSFGSSFELDAVGILDTALFFTPFEEAWKNPYVIGTDREETDTSKYGLRVGMNRIMGSGLRVQLVYLNDDVDDDDIGELVPELARDGAIYALNLNYSIYLSEEIELRPRLSVRYGDYDGEANSFIKYKIDLEARYKTGKWLIAPRLNYSHSDYDQTHPIFDKTRDNDSYGISVMTTYMAPLDFEEWSVAALLALSKGDSNIDFYDTESLTFGGMLNYHF